MKIIKFEGVTKIYSPRNCNKPIVALDNVCFEVADKEFILLTGRSGSGKTTLLKLILKEEAPTYGKIFFEGENIGEMQTGKIPQLRRRIGTVFQDYKLFPNKTIFENVSYIMEVMGADQKEIERDVHQALDLVGLRERIGDFPRELSGGEKQRVAIARALIHRPDVILADEPTGNLDPYNSSEIINLLLKISELGTTIILSTHSKETINKIRKRVITLDAGKVVRDEENGRFAL